MKLPTRINILGNTYKIIPCTTTTEVDVFGNQALYGQIYLRDRTIRVYVAEDRTEFDVIQTLIHEILHGICVEMKYELNDDQIDTFATVILDTFIRNNFIKEEVQ
jgi:hypothetical protein